MRPSLPPDMGDNAAAQATLEARLRREQVKRVSQMEDLANWSGNATDGQVAKYTQATGTWGPGTVGGIQGDSYYGQADFTMNGSSGAVTFTEVNWAIGITGQTIIGSSISVVGSPGRITINTAGVYAITAKAHFFAATNVGTVRDAQFVAPGVSQTLIQQKVGPIAVDVTLLNMSETFLLATGTCHAYMGWDSTDVGTAGRYFLNIVRLS